MNTRRVTNHFLLGFEACSTRGNSCLSSKPSQQPAIWEVRGPSGECTTVLLNGHTMPVERLPNVCVCAHRLACHCQCGQGSLFVLWAAALITGPIAKNKQLLSVQPWMGRNSRTRGRGGCYGVPSSCHWCGHRPLKLKATVTACTRPLPDWAHQHFVME